MSNFDPSKLTQRSGGSSQQRGPRPERIFLAVEKYETPADGFHYAVGHRVGEPNELVRVRLNTVAERSADRPKDNVDKIKAQYVTGENTRDTLADKAKGDIKHIAFDDCRRVAEADGIVEYRAHWPKTISTQPNAEIVTGLAHIRLRDAYEMGDRRIKAQAYVEMIKSHHAADKDTIDQVLTDALAIKDDQGRARDPLLLMRVSYDGKVVATPRLYPSSERTKIFDQALGEHKEIGRKVDADKTIASLMAGDPGHSDLANRQLDTVRALVAGIKGLDEPTYNSTDEQLLGKVRSLFYGAKEGQLQVELISAEKIDFGADSRKTYLKDKDLPQLAAYSLKEPIDETRVREEAGYTGTVVGILRHEDGEPYAVYASPSKMFPKAYKLADLHLTAPAAPEATQEAQAAAVNDEPEMPVMAGEEPADDYDDGVPF